MATKKNIYKEKLEEYLKADNVRKGEILDAVIEVTGLHRKSAIRRFKVLRLQDSEASEKRGRPVYYTPDVTAALKDIWKAASESCGENLHAVIGEYVKILQRDNMWIHSDEATDKLLTMSEGTVKERVSKFSRELLSFGGKSTTKPGSILSMIPVRMDGWKNACVGTCQIDTVAHCGDTTAGDFVFTVNIADVATLWGERRAQWNKGKIATVRNMEYMEKKLPFPVIEWHPDSGSEFINWHCYDTYGDRLTRSRPYHKNDNCFVEERNGHIVRRWLGYTRFDVQETVDAINAMYDILTPYLNHFIASKRIVSKERIGARWKIAREKKAKTPYERILERKDVSEEIKAKLTTEHEKLNPVILKRKIEEQRKEVFNILKRHSNSDQSR